MKCSLLKLKCYLEPMWLSVVASATQGRLGDVTIIYISDKVK